ncbi:MAG: hypothetical protein ISR65_08460 [Bacteriovoracaceae bacterium]|nr:hypothetical protein [Bacteriovoracaceae bacterium]
MSKFAMFIMVILCCTQSYAANEQVPTEVGPLIVKLESIFKGGSHQTFRVDKDYSLKMVKEFILLYTEDEDLFNDYTFVQWQDELQVDSQTAGTMTLKAAISAVQDGVDYMQYGRSNVDPNLKTSAINTIKALKSNPGIYFGFDAMAQNSCAAPTPLMLVIDTVSGLVYGIELNPCW